MNNNDNTTTTEHRSSKNGYEIRTDILALAKSSVEFEYEKTLEQWRLDASSIEKPKVPSTHDVINAANKMYRFVNNTNYNTPSSPIRR